MEWLDTSNRERMVAELTQGRELASQLRMILDNNRADGGVGSAEVIVDKILGSLANTLWILKGKESDEERVSDQNHPNSDGGGGGSRGGAYSSSWGASLRQHDAVKCEDDSQESSKSTPIFKDRRGSYKRRETSHSRTKETSALTDDGHSWRKYGQKVILNANHPRNYFRCTHKCDQDCKAIKQVQKIQDHPPVFRTTYYGNHICRDYLRTSELIVDCSSPRDASNFISFDNSFVANNKQDHPFLPAFSTAVIKEELVVKEEVRAHYPLCDCLVSSAMQFESPGGMSEFLSTLDDFNHEEELVVKELVRAHSPPCDYLASSNAMQIESPGCMSEFLLTLDDFDNEKELVVKEVVRAHSPPCDLVSSDAMQFESPGGMSEFLSTLDDFDHEAVHK